MGGLYSRKNKSGSENRRLHNNRKLINAYLNSSIKNINIQIFSHHMALSSYRLTYSKYIILTTQSHESSRPLLCPLYMHSIPPIYEQCAPLPPLKAIVFLLLHIIYPCRLRWCSRRWRTSRDRDILKIVLGYGFKGVYICPHQQPVRQYPMPKKG